MSACFLAHKLSPGQTSSNEMKFTNFDQIDWANMLHAHGTRAVLIDSLAYEIIRAGAYSEMQAAMLRHDAIKKHMGGK